MDGGREPKTSHLFSPTVELRQHKARVDKMLVACFSQVYLALDWDVG